MLFSYDMKLEMRFMLFTKENNFAFVSADKSESCNVYKYRIINGRKVHVHENQDL